MKLFSLLFLILVFGVLYPSNPRGQHTGSISGLRTGQNVTPFDGGSPNKLAQLEACKELKIVSFSELKQVNNPAFVLLNNSYGKDAEKVYRKTSIYDNAVLLNTAAAASSIGADLSSAVILKPYYSEKSSLNTSFQRLPFGYYFAGFTGIPIPPPGGRASKGDRYRDQGSVEVKTDENGDTHFDVDLYNPESDYYAEHLEELLFNEAYIRPTHPGDVIKKLFEDRKLKTGVTCKN